MTEEFIIKLKDAADDVYIVVGHLQMKHSIKCRYCSQALRRSQTYRSWGRWFRYFGVKPFRCHSCRTLSYHFSPKRIKSKS